MKEEKKESKKEVEETTVPPAPEGEQKQESSKLEADESKQTEDEYKEAYEKSQKILSKAEHTIVKLKKEKKEESKIDLSEIKEELRNEIVQELEESVSGAMRSQLEEFRVEDRENYISDRISELAPTEAYKKMMRDFYTQKIQKGGLTKEAIDQDLQLVKGMIDGLVSSPEIQRQNDELKEALVSKNTVSQGVGASVVNKKSPAQTPTDEDIRIANKFFRGDIERYMNNKGTFIK